MMTQTILIAGATGMLGQRIAHHLLANAQVLANSQVLANAQARVRLLVRDMSTKKIILAALIAKGAEIIEGELSDHAALNRATQGVDVIISAVQGGPDVIIDGQVALAQAGKRNGARRILPSDFGLDLFKATPGEHAMFDMRAKADASIAEIGLEQINILQGAFMDMFLPGRGAIDVDKGMIGFFGDGTMPIELTSVEDTARMAARVAVDPAVPAGKFAFAGSRLSFRQAGEIVAKQTGISLTPVWYGSEQDLRATMATADPQKQVMLAYLLYMTNGQTALSHLQNDRYHDLKLESFEDFIARSVSKTPAS